MTQTNDAGRQQTEDSPLTHRTVPQRDAPAAGSGGGLLPEKAVCMPLTAADLDQVMAIEQRVYPFPWSRRNFEDSLASGYIACLLRDAAPGDAGDTDIAAGRLVGYFLLMPVLDEVHLLNISVDADLQHAGYGQRLMREAIEVARARAMRLILLEVRISNLRALALYRRFGFGVIGRRKNYYPAADNTREDAIMMTLTL